MKLLRWLLPLVGIMASFMVQAVSIAEFSKELSLHKGYFSFYVDNNTGKVYLAVEQYEQQFLFQSSLPNGLGSNDIGLDRGQLGDTRLVQFERVGEKVFLRQLNTDYRANSTNELEQQAIKEAFASAIIWGFKVVANDDNGAVLIDYTPFLLSDIHQISTRLADRQQGNFSIDESRSGLFLKRSKAFINNTELEATVTFKGSKAGNYLRSVTPESTAFTVNLHHSLIKLPDDNYQTRQFHPNSGYWSIAHADYASKIDEPLIKRVIPRHRLSKKQPSAVLSEAVEPIVYYLDAGVPEPVRSALIEGATWWNDAFSAIGYKDAFQVKILPEDADPMDVRYNVIQWVHRATRGWSYGSSIIDPRTGEIIKGHVTLGSLRVRQDYLIALGLTSPFSSADVDLSSMKTMALARIKQLSAHEVGHTLGISHNFAASANGHASVMDYPHPEVSLSEEGKINLANAYQTGMGSWDKQVIAYGYSDFTEQNEAEQLAKLLQQAEQAGLKFISDSDARAASGAHPTAHLWDNGVDPVTELNRVLKIRNTALNSIGQNSIAYGTPWSELEQVLVPIYNFHRYQLEAAVKLIAGVDYSYEVKTQQQAKGAVPVSSERQQQAIASMLATLDSKVLVIPESISQLIVPKAYGYSRDRESFASNTGLTFDPISAAQANANFSLGLLFNNERLARLSWQHSINNAIPSVQQLLAQTLAATVQVPAKTGQELLIQQRVNQEVIEHLLALMINKSLVAEVRAEVYLTLQKLQQWLNAETKGLKAKTNPLTAHYQLLNKQIDHVLSKGELITPASNIKMPPGSPIG